MKYIFSILFLCTFSSMSAQDKKKTWVFIMAGQSNMAGRGAVEAEDTITDPRIRTINRQGQIVRQKNRCIFMNPLWLDWIADFHLLRH